MIWRYLAAFAASLLFACSWLWEAWSISIWLGMILFFCVAPLRSKIQTSFLTTFFGFWGMGFSFYWATKTLSYTLNAEEGSWVPFGVFLMLLIWESIPFLVFGWTLSYQYQRGKPMWLAPSVWVMFECFWPRVFPWSMAHSQTGFPPFLQAAEWGGTALVSFLFVYGCLGVATMLRPAEGKARGWEPLLAIAGVFLAILGGSLRIATLDGVTSAKKLRIGVVQIDPSFVESTEKMRAESDAMEGKIDLLVWPESTIGTYCTTVGSIDEMVDDISVARLPFVRKDFASGLPAPLLVGGKTFLPESTEEGPYWQTAFLIETTGKIASTYNKRHLIPIGEFVPFEKYFPWLHEWAQLGEYFERGKSDAPIAMADGVSVGTLICYEDLIESASRKTVNQGAQVLISLINASAFETVESLEQHRRLSLIRAIENRRCFVRCAGTGVSCFIDATGREVHRLGPMLQGHFVVEVPLRDSTTLYQYVGFAVPYIVLGVTLVGFGWRSDKKRVVGAGLEVGS